MGQYRKKPIVIEAEQWFPDKPVEGVQGPFRRKETSPVNKDAPYWWLYWTVITLEGVMEVLPGDWIITGIKGEKYPCKPDIFEATYEAVDAVSISSVWEPCPAAHPLTTSNADGFRGTHYYDPVTQQWYPVNTESRTVGNE